MSSNFSISDFIARINVALSRKLVSVYVDRTLVNIRLLDVFYKNGLIRGFELKDDAEILVLLKYHLSLPIPRYLKIISTPGRRVFWKLGRLSLNYHVGAFYGFFIISSPKGFITSNDCLLSLRTSGEVILQVMF